jgi:hypothetical protein
MFRQLAAARIGREGAQVLSRLGLEDVDAEGPAFRRCSIELLAGHLFETSDHISRQASKPPSRPIESRIQIA